ncbi:MAG: metallophosphoesterase [Myxococcota bacterium]
MRILHVSDVHLEDGFRGVPPKLFANKRFAGYLNLRLKRRRHFEGAAEKLGMLAELAAAEGVDAVLCSGDYTALGTEPELAFARTTVQRLVDASADFVTVPGNHDVYLPDALGSFERHFGDLMTSDLPEVAVDGPYPHVRLLGEHVAVVSVNSARPNPPITRSSGFVPEAQLEALERVLADARVAERFVFVMTHYAPRLWTGEPDSPSHGLDNADAFLAACGGLRRGAIVHGHVHRCYTVRVPDCPVPLFGAGSTTQAHREGLWLYDVGPEAAEARQGRFDGTRYVVDGEPVVL